MKEHSIQEALQELYDRIETLNAKIDSVDKNVTSKSVQAVHASQEYTQRYVEHTLNTKRKRPSTIKKMWKSIKSNFPIKITITKGK